MATACRKPRLPYGWTPHVSKTYPNRVYYFNEITGEAAWDLSELEFPLQQNFVTQSSIENICAATNTFSSNAQTNNNKIVAGANSASNSQANNRKIVTGTNSSNNSQTNNRKNLAGTNSSNNTQTNRKLVSGPNSSSNANRKIAIANRKIAVANRKIVAGTNALSNVQINRKTVASTNSSSNNAQTCNRKTVAGTNKSNELKNSTALFSKSSVNDRKIQCSGLYVNNFMKKENVQNKIIQRENILNTPKNMVRKVDPPNSQNNIIRKEAVSNIKNNDIRKEYVPNIQNNIKRKEGIPNFKNDVMRKECIPNIRNIKKNTQTAVVAPICSKVKPDLPKCSTSSQNAKKRKSDMTIQELRRNASNNSKPEHSSILLVNKTPSGIENSSPSAEEKKAILLPSPAESNNDFLSTDVEMIDVSTELATLDGLVEPELMTVEDPNSYYIVLDTNILISNLKYIDELKDTPLEGCGPPHIYIPWIVVQELDGIKTRHGKSTKGRVAAEAIRYLFSKMKSKHPRFHGQSPDEAAKCPEKYRDCNDDRILGCCMRLVDKISQEKVILLTNDRNLALKAVICEVKVHSWDSLLENLKTDVKIKEITQSKVREAKQARTLTVNESTVAVTVTQECKEKKTSGMSKRKLRKCRKKLQLLKNAENNAKRAVDSIICEAKVLLKSVLEPFYVKEMTNAYEETWKNFGDSIQPPYVLTEILESINKYWSTVFRLILPPSHKQHFELLHEKIKFTQGFLYNEKEALAVLTSTKSIFFEIQKRHMFEADVPLQRIEELIVECKELCQQQEVLDSSICDTVSQFVLPVFEYIWSMINRLCGMTCDFHRIPHSFSYVKPEVMPSKAEFDLLVSNLFPSVHQVKRYMASIFNSPNDEIFSQLYKALINFVPSLQIQATLPPCPDFSKEKLKAFCTNPQSKELLENGYKQLCTFHAKLSEALEAMLAQSRPSRNM